MVVCLNHVVLIYLYDFLSGVFNLREQWKELGKIHLAPRIEIGSDPEISRQGLVPALVHLDLIGQLTFPGESDIVEFVLKALLKDRNILVKKLAP
jgi:hypothetical protein